MTNMPIVIFLLWLLSWIMLLHADSTIEVLALGFSQGMQT
jgi:hypothetical protein